MHDAPAALTRAACANDAQRARASRGLADGKRVEDVEDGFG